MSPDSQETKLLNPFKENFEGRLMAIRESESSRYEFEVWFDYTRNAIKAIREGDLIAVPNFTIPDNPKKGNRKHVHYTILGISSMMPLHYAMPDESRGYPGFLMEAARSASADWRQQDDIATEDTTKIRCKAVPTNLELIDPILPNDKERKIQLSIQDETNLPMLGETAKLLTSEATENVWNRGINPKVEKTVVAGTLIRDDDVKILVRVEDLLKTHFGVFGFTGAGKSNLVSTIIAKLFGETDAVVKVLLFDLMGEYLALLMDKLAAEKNHAQIICLGEETLPGGVFKFINEEKDSPTIDAAALELLKTSLFPKRLKGRPREDFLPLAKALLQRKRFKIYRPSESQKWADLIEGLRGDLFKGTLGNSKPKLEKLIDDIVKQFGNTIASPSSAVEVKNYLDAYTPTDLTPTAKGNLQNLLRKVDAIIATKERPLHQGLKISLSNIIGDLNNSDHSSLYVIMAHEPDELREFAWHLGNYTYDVRRQEGIISPIASFIFDEADEFIPLTPKDSQELSSQVIATLARRGRKFGLGIGIATQRVTYLNTSIMAQIHTYLISKLPRKIDQERIIEAFGIPSDVFSQTFKFRKGNWLLASHDATGVDAFPIPIQTENAEIRIENFLEEVKQKIAQGKSKNGSLLRR